MKLANVVMTFTEGKLTLNVPGTEYAVAYSMMRQGLINTVKTEIFPVHLNDLGPNDDLPDEVECMLAEGEMLLGRLGHHLSCRSHAEQERLMLSDIHENLSKSKVRLPHITELMLEGIIVSLVTGLTQMEAIAMGHVHGRLVNTEPNEAEMELLAQVQVPTADFVAGVFVTNTDLSEVKLDFVPTVPALTDAERVTLQGYYDEIVSRIRAQKSAAAAMTVHPGHTH